ncbi:MAG TPA: general secretion pathway protein GspB [Gammaproteobacteria bacterium]|nr:general secretion pathway protein GspB [Gammaproteobacteria bacterium]
MSLLLDALKRSEQEREQTLEGRLSHAGRAPGLARTRTPWAVIIALLLCVNIGLLAIWFDSSRHKVASQRVEASVPATLAVPHEVRSLAREAALGVTAQTAGATPAPAPQAVAAGTTAASSSAPKASAAAPGDAPPLETLPQSVQHQLPELQMEIHVYAPDPAKRFVMINMHRYVEGDTLADGPKVVSITADGVVLRYQGQTFLLPVRE